MQSKLRMATTMSMITAVVEITTIGAIEVQVD
jgi:hypothetical protein